MNQHKFASPMAGGVTADASSNDCLPQSMKIERQPHGIAGVCGMVIVSFALGLTALVVAFVAASAFETQGTTSNREVIAGCVAVALYLAFCQFWVAPRRSGFMAKLPTVVASVVPLLSVFASESSTHAITQLTSGCLGSVVGALIAHRLTARPTRDTPSAVSINRGKRCRSYLLAGFVFMSAMALAISIGVIPSVVADTARGSYAQSNGVFLGGTVVFDLLVAALLGFAIRRCREHDHSSKGTLGITAFVALLLGLIYCGFGVLFSGYGPALRIASMLLLLCALIGLITTALMIVTSVIVDRARLSALPVR